MAAANKKKSLAAAAKNCLPSSCILLPQEKDFSLAQRSFLFLRHFAAAIEKNVIAAEAGWDIIT
jgi:hypothetical protein